MGARPISHPASAVALAVMLGVVAACDAREPRDEDGGAVVATPAPPRPMAATLDTSRLADVFADAADMDRIRSLLVHWRGELVREQYFHGATRTTRANIKSASKSIISALVGIALAQGHLDSVRQPIAELLPADTRALDATKRAITVEDLLSMRAGLRSTSFDNYGAWVSSRNWVQSALRQPFVAEPGGPMIYSTGSSHLLSAILTRATGMSTHAFADRYLARPLGFTLRPWQRDPQGIYFGGNDMYLTPGDMLRIGTLYLNGGRVNGRQVLPAAWIDSSWVPRTSSPYNGNRYGYGWWTRTAHGHDVRYAWGYGGQFIFVVPTLQLVVVVTSDAVTPREGGHTRAVHRLLEHGIMPAVLQ